MQTDLLRNTFYLTVASIGQKAIAFVYFLFVARVLQPERTGMYFLTISLAMIFSVISDTGITPVVIREIAKTPQQTKQIFQRAFATKLPFLLMGYGCTVAAALFLGYDREIIWLTVFSGLSLLLDSIHLLFYGVLRAHQRLEVESLGMFGGQLFVALIGGLSLWISPSLFWLMIALVVGSSWNVLLSGLALVRRFGVDILKPHWQWNQVQPLMKTALPFALAAVFVKVYSYVDTVLISKFLDASAVGVYSVAYKITYAFQFLPMAFIASLYPKFSATLIQEPERLGWLFRRSLWYMMLLATPIVFGIWLIAEQVIQLVGDSYVQAGAVLSILIFVLFPLFLDFPIGSLLNASGKQATKTTIMGLTMVLNVFLNVLLIPTFGPFGAAWAALISFTFLCGAGFVVIRTLVTNVPWKQIGLDVLRIGLSGFGMLTVGILLLPIIGWVFTIGVCALVYASCLWVVRAVTLADLSMIFARRSV